MKKLVAAGLLAIFIAVPATSLGAELTAKNADSALLHDINDYLEWISEDVLPKSERKALLESGTTDLRDNFKKDGSGYQLIYTFHTPEVLAFTTLVVTSKADEAPKAAAGFIKFVQASVEQQDHTLKSIEIPAEFPYSGTFYTELDASGTPLGNVLVVTNGEHMYASRIAGGGGFVRFEEAREYLAPKLDKIMKFTPQPSE